MSETNPMTEATPASTTSPARGQLGAVVRGLLRQPRFVVAAAVLLLCAIGFNAAARALHFRKLPLKLQVRALDDKTTGIGPVLGGRWAQVGEDRPLPPETEK